MSEWKDVALFLYGDVRKDIGFWYSHPLFEIDGLTDDQLFWIPSPNSLCILWHVGHVAHRERTHIGRFLQGIKGTIIPPQYEVFGPDWCSVEDLRRSIDSVEKVLDWTLDVRQKSREYVESLNEADFHSVPPTSELGLSVAHWLFITTSHTALHLGRIQLLRSLIEGKRERAC